MQVLFINTGRVNAAIAREFNKTPNSPGPIFTSMFANARSTGLHMNESLTERILPLSLSSMMCECGQVSDISRARTHFA